MSHFLSAPQLSLSAMGWLGVEAIAIVLAGVSIALRSKLWPLALTVALVMFLLAMFVVGS